jgi:hypothetical protein
MCQRNPSAAENGRWRRGTRHGRAGVAHHPADAVQKHKAQALGTGTVQDLRDWDLCAHDRLLPRHLAGADLTGARLPEHLSRDAPLAQLHGHPG